MQYRRAKIKGGTYFFTVNLADRNESLLIDYIDVLRNEFSHVKNQRTFKIDGIVILPDHIHAIWTLPEDDSDFSTRWRLIKSGFSKKLPKTERINQSRQNKKERGIWQRRFWEHQIQDENDFIQHMNYMYYNPVKHGYVENVKDWLYSSFHRDIKLGVYDVNWGSGVAINLDVGELE